MESAEQRVRELREEGGRADSGDRRTWALERRVEQLERELSELRRENKRAYERRPD
jgi:hypothetical protein